GEALTARLQGPRTPAPRLGRGATRWHAWASTLVAAAIATFLAAGASSPALAAVWIASGTVKYRDREFNQNGFTGNEPVVNVRFADVEVVSGNNVLATGATTSTGTFSINVTDSQTRDVFVRVITRSNYTPTLFLKVSANTQGSQTYSIVSSTVIAHNQNQN